MKNLSLQMASTAMLKKTAEAANKSNGMVDKASVAEPNNSFQMMLNRQVKNQKDSAENSSVLQEAAQKMSSLQNNTGLKVVDEKQESKAGSMELVAKVDAASQTGDKIKNIKISIDGSESKNNDVMGGVSAKAIEEVALNAKALFKLEEGVDAKSEETLINAEDVSGEVSVASFVQAIFTPVVNVIDLVKTQEIASEVVGKNSLQSPNTADAGLQKQRNLDAVLSNTIAQSNSTQSKDAQGAGIKTAENSSQIDTNITSEQTHWQAVMQRSAVKQAVDAELVNVKLTSNIAKDSINKEVIMPASYQSAAQSNPITPTQQTASSSNIIQAYPGKSGWDQAISQKVVWMVGAGEQSATLTLNPPDLGPLQVVISVSNDMVDTNFMSDNAEVRQALQDGMANLREKLSESGIQLGQASISSGGQAKQEFQQATQNRLASQLNSNAPVFPEEKTAIANTKVRLMNGLVDTFV